MVFSKIFCGNKEKSLKGKNSGWSNIILQLRVRVLGEKSVVSFQKHILQTPFSQHYRHTNDPIRKPSGTSDKNKTYRWATLNKHNFISSKRSNVQNRKVLFKAGKFNTSFLMSKQQEKTFSTSRQNKKYFNATKCCSLESK